MNINDRLLLWKEAHREVRLETNRIPTVEASGFRSSSRTVCGCVSVGGWMFEPCQALPPVSVSWMVQVCPVMDW